MEDFMKHLRNKTLFGLLILAVVLSACATAPATTAPASATTAPAAATLPAFPTAAPGDPVHLRLATTTSTQDSGLLTVILPDFEKQCSCKVDVVAVGTGQAIAIGQKGDADVLLVHARKSEDAFVTAGDAKERFDVMYNDFIILGPKDDPAKAASAASAVDAFKAIMNTSSTFASRGDKSGTNTKELSLWSSIGVTPTKDLKWYKALGQGMGETLNFANEQNAYTLSDRGTYLAQKDKLPNLIIIFGGNSLAENKDTALLNPYGVLAVNPDKHPGVKFDLAMQFIKWITSVDEQQKINDYGQEKFGQSLFYPASAEWKAAHS
jgi:tungstate transport system substrate-binding protein